MKGLAIALAQVLLLCIALSREHHVLVRMYALNQYGQTSHRNRGLFTDFAVLL